MKKIKAGIVGGTGYTGAELLRILLTHPDVEICGVCSRSNCGEYVGNIHKNLNGFTDLKFSEKFPEELAPETDVMFLALPNGNAKDIAPEVIKRNPDIKIVDLSGDFRLIDAQLYELHYGKMPEKNLHEKFVYGLCEFNREMIKGADYIANPGCFATGMIFALTPLAKEGLLDGNVSITGLTGSSGSGAKAKAGTHHPRREGNFWAYKMLDHQHEPEVKQFLENQSQNNIDFAFVPHSLPVVRGIFITATIHLSKKINNNEVADIFQNYYANEFFVRHVEGSPELKSVAGTNMVEYSYLLKDNTLIVMTAIDNLVKGAAGQAVQNMNLMFGLDEKTGLNIPCIYP